MKISKAAWNAAVTLICIILGVMLALQYKSINFNQSILSSQNKRMDELKDDLIRLQKGNDALKKRLEELQQENKLYADARSGNDVVVENLHKQLLMAQMMAGLVEVKGRGLIITLDNGEFVSVEDEDILAVINELRASDAQAISVNNQRISAMSEIRSAPPYIMINGLQMTSPFEIRAIGDPDKMERSLKIINGVIEKLEGYGLNVSLKQAENILLPKLPEESPTRGVDLLKPANP